ncbi:MAG TPA: hypothetical protein VLN45_08215 [Ignavibacteriaceae bacterium]|nr:hypothetical protein [Ignavibacteriaceae bacterium]
MNQKLIFLISSFIIIIGCNKDELTSVNIKGEGKFKVDTLEYLIEKGIAPNDSLWNYVEYTVAYHYENYRGTLNNITFILSDSIGIALNIDYAYPDSINKIISWTDKLWLGKALKTGDSVKVECSMSGAFWEEINSEVKFVDTFKWQSQQLIYYNK